MSQAIQLVREAIAEASRGLVQRETTVELVVLSAVAREHVLVVGPPGTAKSEAVRRVARALGGRYFEYLLGRFTEPSEIFGAVDLKRLREGVVATDTRGMLPEAEIAFLDEVFLGSTAILNTLLGLLNERAFRRGHTDITCPLEICVGASNALPDEPGLAAFADRFLVHVFVDPISDPHLEELLAQGWALEAAEVRSDRARIEALAAVARAARQVDLDGVRGALAEAIRLLRGAGITLSDRRAVKTQRLVAAAAAIDGRDHATGADLWPIVFAVPERDAQLRGRDRLRPLLEASRSEALTAAVEAASLGPLARAKRLVSDGRALLDQRPSDHDELRRWSLRLEGVVRESMRGSSPPPSPPFWPRFVARSPPSCVMREAGPTDRAIEVRWQPREPALSPAGVVARGEIVPRLVERLRRDDQMGRLRGVAGDALLALFGADLPWVDGVVYLGLESGLYMPCWLRPTVPSRVLARCLEARHGRSQWVVLPPHCAFAADEARAVDAGELDRRYEGLR